MAAMTAYNDAACHSLKLFLHRAHSALFCPPSLPAFETQLTRKRIEEVVKEFSLPTAHEAVPTVSTPWGAILVALNLPGETTVD